jgi:hypothetical protein
MACEFDDPTVRSSKELTHAMIDTEKANICTVMNTSLFLGLGHEHEVRAPIHSGAAGTGSHPAVEIHVDARELRVIDKESEKDRAEVQKTMLGPEVLDSEGHHEIVFKSTDPESASQGHWTLRGNLTLRGQTRRVTIQVTSDAVQGGDPPSKHRHSGPNGSRASLFESRTFQPKVSSLLQQDYLLAPRPVTRLVDKTRLDCIRRGTKILRFFGQKQRRPLLIFSRSRRDSGGRSTATAEV